MKRFRARWATFIWIFFWGLPGILRADPNSVKWGQFRGPNSSGLALESAELPTDFAPDKNVLWKTDVPPGHSSPVLAGDYLFLTAFQQQTLFVIGINRNNGKIVWQREVPKDRNQEMHKANSPASPSPVTDGKNVYAFFPDFGLVAFSTEGQDIWRLPLGPFNNPMGMGASPILVDDKVIMNCDQESGSFLIAVDKESGTVRWRTARPDFSRGFATPVVYRPTNEPPQILISGSFRLMAYSAATGKEIWWLGGLSWQMKGTPVIGDDMIFINGWAGGADEGQQESIPAFDEVLKKEDANHDGKLSFEEISNDQIKKDWKSMDLDGDGFIGERDWRFYRLRRSAINSCSAFRLGKQGDETDHSFVWHYPKSLPNVPSPLLYKKILYLIKEGGIFTALDSTNGKVLKQARLQSAPGDYFASPIMADDKIFTVSQEGKVSVISPGKEWEVLATNDMEEECYSTPAVGDGRLYIRTKKTLYCIGKR